MKSVSEFIQALCIFAKYLKNGMDTGWFLEAAHDIIYMNVSAEQLPEDSEDGIKLGEMGWHISSDTDGWAYFV